MRLNIRRLFREILGQGLKTNDLVCLEAIDEPSLPDFFDRRKVQILLEAYLYMALDFNHLDEGPFECDKS